MPLSEHLEKLRHFHKLVHYRSIREGAAAINMSQAGLSKSISALESILETRLFVRSKDGLTLTQEGEEVLKASERILSESARLETRLQSFKTLSVPKKLRVGMYDSVAVYFFSDLNSYIRQLYPSVRIELTVDTSSALYQGIGAKSLDLAIGVNWENSKSKNFQHFKLFDDHYSFYISSKLDSSKAEQLPLLIHARAGDQDGVNLETHLKSPIKERGIHRIFNFETLKTLTVQGLGIGVLPTQVAKPLVSKDQLVPFQIQKTRNLFGAHSIGFIATPEIFTEHRDFCENIYRLGERWSKS